MSTGSGAGRHRKHRPGQRIFSLAVAGHAAIAVLFGIVRAAWAGLVDVTWCRHHWHAAIQAGRLVWSCCACPAFRTEEPRRPGRRCTVPPQPSREDTSP